MIRLNKNYVLKEHGGLELVSTLGGSNYKLSQLSLALIRLVVEETPINEILKNEAFAEMSEKDIRHFIEQLISEGVLENDEMESIFVNKKIDFSCVYASKNTFLNSTWRMFEDIPSNAFVFFGVPFDLGTTGFPGARFGPDKLREISCDGYDYSVDILTDLSKGWLVAEKENPLLEKRKMYDLGNVFFVVGESYERIYEKIFLVIERIIKVGSIPIMIGGDHSITYSALRAACVKYKKVNLLHIDAHTDFGDLFEGMSVNHGNFLTGAKKDGFIDHVYQFGQRWLIGEKENDEKYHLVCANDLFNDKNAQVKFFKSDFPYYLTIDIDVLDPVYVPGTGTPVSDGLQPRELYSLLHKLLQEVNVIGFDLVEFNPMMDRNNQTAEQCLRIIMSVMNNLHK